MIAVIADLHCDLLFYLQGGSRRSVYDQALPCSVPSLHAGHVQFQVLPIFAETGKNSAEKGLAQAEIYKVFPNQYPNDFESIQVVDRLELLQGSEKIGIIAAIENASSFCEEAEEIEAGLERLIQVMGKVGRPLYISLTWNEENRFGGGTFSSVGLKDDGRRLLEFMDGKQIAVDLSHSSDALAYDILLYLQEKKLHIPILASHSNMRSVCNTPRNLPGELVQEIAKRGGLIGLNLVRPLVASKSQPFEEALAAQLETALSLAGEDHVALGADFFYDKDLPRDAVQRAPEGFFYPDFNTSACYPRLLALWKKKLNVSEECIGKLACQNVFAFLRSIWKEKAIVSSPMIPL